MSDSRPRQRDGELIEVAVALPVASSFVYAACDGEAPPRPGCRVLVPFGKRRVTGYVLGAAEAPPSGVSVRKIAGCLDSSPMLTPEVISLCRWAAEYYMHPLGEVLSTALPPGLQVSSERWATITEAGKSAESSDPEIKEALSCLRERSSGVRVGGRRGHLPLNIVQRLVRRGWVSIDERMGSSRTGHRTTRLISPLVDRDTAGEMLPAGAPVQAAVMEWLAVHGPVTSEELRAAFPKAGNALRRLSERGLVSVEEVHAVRHVCTHDDEALAGESTPHRPTSDQKAVLNHLIGALGPPGQAGKFSPFLLEGVTGSGKTEVYLRLIEEILPRGRGALVLVPEIALTPQLAGRFRARLGDLVAVLHSGLSAGERHDEWWRLRRGEARVAVGVRSAVFAPVADLGLVVVDEEHETSFKQEEGFRYHARDLALVRGSKAGAVVLLGSATPSMESLENARRGRYGHLRLPERVMGRRLPDVTVVDLRRELPRSGTRVNAGGALLSDKLLSTLADTVSSGKQAIVFLNRRGHAPSVVCVDCGEVARCPGCEVSLTLHVRPRRMLCHYCGHECLPSEICAACEGRLRPIGAGTQAVEDEILHRLPSLRVSRLDRDTTSRRGAVSRILSHFAGGRSDVLLGTQMVAKGHDFPGVTLVGVVLADTGLLMPDFRAAERTFQILSQVAGRAGRGDEPGKVLVQTWRPEQPSVCLASAADYKGFSSMELERRRAGRWPPFCRLLMVRVEGEDAEAVASSAAAIATTAEAAAVAYPEADLEVLGPAPAPLTKLRGRYRFQVLLKAPSPWMIRWISGALSSVEPATGVDVALDVDPVGML